MIIGLTTLNFGCAVVQITWPVVTPSPESTRSSRKITLVAVAKAVVDSQGFDSRMLKPYFRDWPVESEGTEAAPPQ